MPRVFRVLCALLAASSSLVARTISVSELMYNPLGGSDYEFIELVNLGAAQYNLAGAKFTNGITYTFPANTLLPAGGRIVVAVNRTAFAERYGTIPQLAGGANSGKLNDGGEEVALVDAANALLFKLSYDSGNGWPSRANGLGSSLECIDPNGNLNDPENWRPSAEYHGSPGQPGVGPQRTVQINEVLAHTDPPLEDAVELINLTDGAIDIGGWFLSNTRATPKKFKVPAGTSVPAHSYLVIYEWQFNPRAGQPQPPPGASLEAFTFNSAHGDEAVLMSADAGGNLKLWVDSVSFEASENGWSFGRYPDGTGALVIMSDLSLGTAVRADWPAQSLDLFRTGTGAPNALPKLGPVAFTQIMYYPPLNKDEYLELQNTSAATLKLYDELHATNTWRLRQGVDFDFPLGVAVPAAGKFIVSGLPPATFRAKYSIPAEVQVFGPWTGGLDKDGETVAVYKPDPPQLPPHPDAGFVPYILVEEIAYRPGPPWPTGATGTGPALQRIDATKYGNDPANWTTTGAALPVTLTATLQSNGQLRIAFTAQAGRTYGLEARELVNSGAWNRDANLPAGNAGPAQFLVTPGSSAGFHRVVTP